MWIIYLLLIVGGFLWWKSTQKKEDLDKPNSVTSVTVEIIDMKNIKLDWSLPTTRTSGLPLDVKDVSLVEVALSADAGTNWAVLGTVLPGVAQTFTQTELEVGDWKFRLVVVDTAGTRSAEHFEDVNVPDETPPGTVTNVIVTIT